MDIDSRWLGYVVASRPLIDWSVATSDGTKMPRTSWDKFAEYRLSVPAWKRQLSIADYLDAETGRIDALIENKRRLVELLEERVWLVFMNLLRETGSPACQIRRMLSFITDGPFGSAFKSSDYSPDGAAVVRLGNIGFAEYRDAEQAFISLDLFRQFLRHEVRKGDLLIAGLGDATNHAGRACVAPDLGPAMVKGKCFCARVLPDLADAEFLALLLSSPLGSELLRLSARGSTRTMLNLEVVKETVVPLPRVEVQREVVASTHAERDRCHELRVSLDAQLSLYLERRQALITAAVTGQLPIPGLAA
jgi:type I restriction enzyme S subunit